MTEQADVTMHRQSQVDGGEMLLVSFRLRDEEFGIDIASVQEILRMPDITPIPRSSGFVAGITNIRGSILPVVDAKKRLKLAGSETSELNRVLVVSHDGALTGLIVDEVNEVIRIDRNRIEPPPPVTRGVDRFYLSGIVKLDAGRLVMMLNLSEVLHLEMKHQDGQLAAGRETTTPEKEIEHIHHAQLVSFSLGRDEFAFDIEAVLEIIRAGEITAVPNVPDSVVGIRTLRDKILPVIDLRQIVHKPRLVEENLERIRTMKRVHNEWIEALAESLLMQKPFSRTTDPGKCQLGQMLAERQTSGAELRAIHNRIQRSHMRTHAGAVNALQMMNGNPVGAREFLESDIRPNQVEIVGILDEMEKNVAACMRREQKILIVESRGMQFGLLVDRINEVLRVPTTAIDSTPALIAGHGRELKGIAKLNDGGRLIMVMDENALISQKEAEALSQIGNSEADGSRQAEHIEQIQYVVFSICGEEFGIVIERVQEIFRIAEIAPVPKAPEFVAGLTNLRGVIIPVIDMRRRFGMKDMHSEFLDALREVRHRFHDFRQEVERGFSGARLDELQKTGEDDLSAFLTSFRSANDGVTARMAELATLFADIRANINKYVQLLRKNKDRGEAVTIGQLQDDFSHFEALLQERLNCNRIDLLKNEKILVVSTGTLAIGLLVDSVHEVISIPVTAVEPAPELVLNQIESGYLQGIAKMDQGRRMILLFNIDEMLSKVQFNKLMKLSQGGGEPERAESDSPPAASGQSGRRKLRIEE